MARAATSGFGSGWIRWGVALACLALPGCAGDKPPVMAKAPPAPMVTPQPPPSSPEFNAATAKPLPIPVPPNLRPLATPEAPGPLDGMAPLPRPEPLELGAVPVPEPGTPAQIARPMPRPADAPSRSAAAAPPPTPAPPPATAADTAADTADIGEAGVAGGVRLLFAPGSAELPAAAAPLLRDLADTMARDPRMRLKVAAYASGEAENPVPARRLSLQRALKVREALAGEGIASLRVDVLALGLNADAPPMDRVDLIPLP